MEDIPVVMHRVTNFMVNVKEPIGLGITKNSNPTLNSWYYD